MTPFDTLEDIICKLNLSLINNPKGIDKYWPKSYINFFYEDLFKSKINKNQLNQLIEINNINPLSLNLWKEYNKNLLTYKVNVLNNKLAINYTQYVKEKVDIIIVNQSYKIKNLNNLAHILTNYANDSGHIVFEDISTKYLNIFCLIFTLPINYRIKVYDFRLKRFISNNCIACIQKTNQKITNFSHRFSTFIQFLYFFCIEIIVLNMPRFIKILKNIL